MASILIRAIRLPRKTRINFLAFYKKRPQFTQLRRPQTRMDIAKQIHKAKIEREHNKHHDLMKAFCDTFALNKHLLEALLEKPSTRQNAPDIERNPILSGHGSFFINIVTIHTDTGTPWRLVEKCVSPNSAESAFWQSHTAKHLKDAPQAHIVRPISILTLSDAHVLYFPFIAAANQSPRSSKEHFRTNLNLLAEHCAAWNAANLSKTHIPDSPNSFLLGRPPSRIRQRHIRRHLNITSKTKAAKLSRQSQFIHDHWAAVQERIQRIPATICHNDLGPGNFFQDRSTAYIIDLAKASYGPLGSDLHTLLRWGRTTLHDEHAADALITRYQQALSKHDINVAKQDILIASWAVFYARYSQLHRWKSARNQDAFLRALDEGLRLVQERL